MYSYQISNDVDKALKTNQDKINSLPKWIKKEAEDHYAEKLAELCDYANKNEDYIITGKIILGIGNEIVLWAESMDKQYKINPSLEEVHEKIDKLVEEVGALRKEIEELKEAVEKLGANLDSNEEPNVETDEESSEVEIIIIVIYDAGFEGLHYLLEQLLYELN